VRSTLNYFDIEDITVGSRHRTVRPEKIEAIAQSMRQIGLRNPIQIVRRNGVAFLVAGAHRLAAARQLGWSQIQAIELKETDPHVEVWEIDENLARAELSATEQAEHLARRQTLWEELVQAAPVSEPAAPPVSRRGGRGKKGFAKAIAERTGVDKSTITRALARAERTTTEVRDIIRDTKADTGRNLDELGKIPKARQAAAARQMVEQAQAGAGRAAAPTTTNPTPEPVTETTPAIDTVRCFAEFCAQLAPAHVANGVIETEAEEIIRHVTMIRAWLSHFVEKLEQLIAAFDEAEKAGSTPPTVLEEGTLPSTPEAAMSGVADVPGGSEVEATEEGYV
jgi:ParB-like chromosome segregation protein Spo0J